MNIKDYLNKEYIVPATKSETKFKIIEIDEEKNTILIKLPNGNQGKIAIPFFQEMIKTGGYKIV